MGYFQQAIQWSQRKTFASGIALSRIGRIWAQTTPNVIANDNTERSLFTGGTTPGAGIGSLIIPASYLVAGSSIRFTLMGTANDVAALPTVRIRAMLNAVAIADTTAIAQTAALTTALWELEGQITCLTTGSTGTVNGIEMWWLNSLTQGGLQATGVAVTVNTTIAQTFDLKFTWGTASGSNTITTLCGMVELCG